MQILVKQKTQLINVCKQHSIDKILFDDNINVCWWRKIVTSLTEVATGVFRLGEEEVKNMVGVVPG